jgi:hypothetical protein
MRVVSLASLFLVSPRLLAPSRRLWRCECRLPLIPLACGAIAAALLGASSLERRVWSNGIGALTVCRLVETQKMVVEGAGATGLAALLPGGATPLNMQFHRDRCPNVPTIVPALASPPLARPRSSITVCTNPCAQAHSTEPT